MRVLLQYELAYASGGDVTFVEPSFPIGGLDESGYQTTSMSGGVQLAGVASTVLKWAAQSAAWDILSAPVKQFLAAGVSGPNANENDNGGTSYGIGVCNTFGCPAGSWP